MKTIDPFKTLGEAGSATHKAQRNPPIVIDYRLDIVTKTSGVLSSTPMHPGIADPIIRLSIASDRQDVLISAA